VKSGHKPGALRHTVGGAIGKRTPATGLVEENPGAARIRKKVMRREKSEGKKKSVGRGLSYVGNIPSREGRLNNR